MSWLGSIGLSVCGSILMVQGCVPSVPTGFDSPDPGARMAAIVRAGTTGDVGAIPELIEQLESNDPGARLLSIRALERMTSQTLGYDHAAPWWERAEAVDRWRRWAVEHGLAGGGDGPVDGEHGVGRGNGPSGGEACPAGGSD